MITAADTDRVVAAIRAAEQKTAGEIFCVITHASSSYRLVPIAWAALVALLVPLLLIYLTKWPAGTIYLAQLVAFIVTAAILSVPALRYIIVPRHAMHERAHAEAMRQFLGQGLQLTDDRTGVLIFASIAEHYAEIVADTGINAKVGKEVWEDAIAAMIAAIKDGRAGEGFVAAIERCGDVLAEHFPPGAINRNELPNKLVVM
jgi:putative membrane protein